MKSQYSSQKSYGDSIFNQTRAIHDTSPIRVNLDKGKHKTIHKPSLENSI